MSEPISLYLHIPFCPYRCSYCDFNTYTSLNELRGEYATGLAHELALVAQGSRLATDEADWVENRPVRTIGFGGGTPSLMSIPQLEQILGAVATDYQMNAATAISFEINPETVDLAYLQALRQLGVSRLSIGAQSAVTTELDLLGREHGFDAVVTAVALARAAGFDNLNVDLIYGVPGQTMASWQQSLTAALALETQHLSLYCLSVEPGTQMARWIDHGSVAAPDPDLAADQYQLAETALAAAGYTHYEISNWSKPGFESPHSLVYWRNQEFLGLGAGAHGFVAGVRYDVVRQPRVYLRRLAQTDAASYPWSPTMAHHHVETPDEAMSTTVLMQLRLLQEGVGLDDFGQRFGRRFEDVYAKPLARFEANGWLERTAEQVRLTPAGRFVSNQIFVEFI